MRTKLQNRIMAFMTAFSIVITLLGGLPVRAEEPEHLLPEKLESSLKTATCDRDSFWLTCLSREKTAEGDQTKALMHRASKDAGTVTLYVRNDRKLVAPEGVQADKDRDVPPYKAYTFKAEQETEIQLTGADAQASAFPELVATEGRWYSVLSEEAERDVAKEKTDVAKDETPEEKAQTDAPDSSDRKAEPLQLFQKPQTDNCMDEKITHILKIHKVDKETREAMAHVAFTAQGQCDQIVSGKTDENGNLELELALGAWRLKEETPQGYKDHSDYLVLVKPDKVDVFEVMNQKKTKKNRKKRALETSKHDPASPIKAVTAYTCSCRPKTAYMSEEESKKRLWATSGDSIQIDMAFTLNDTAKAGDTFQMHFDDKLKPGSLTVPYNAPVIYLKDNPMPAALPSYNAETNTVTYTLTEVCNGKRNIEMYVYFDSVGARGESPDIKPNDWNTFTNTVTGVSGGHFQKTNRIFVDYGSTDEQIAEQSQNKNNWSIGAFTKVWRGVKTPFVDAVFYVNMKPGNRVWWTKVNRTVTFDTFGTLGNLENLEVYRIPDSKKDTLIKRSFPDPEDIEALSPYRYYGNIEQIREGNRDIICLPDDGAATDGYILKVRYPADQMTHKNGDDRVALKANWRGNKGGHQWEIKHISEYAGGEVGQIVADLLVENERKNPDLLFVKTDEAGKGLEGAAFELRPLNEENADHKREAVSGEDGQILFKDVPEDRYALWETKTSDESFILPENALMEVVIRKGAAYKVIKDFAGNEKEERLTKENHTIVNQSKGKVRLVINKVDDDTKKPLKGAEFTLFDHDGKAIKTVCTDESGRAEIENLIYGTYSLKETKAPDGYICDDTAQTVVVKKDNSFQVPNVLGRDVSERITLSKSALTKDVLHDEERDALLLYPNKGERIKITNTFTIKADEEKIQPGDYFYVMLSDNINPYGIVPQDEVCLDIESPYGTLAKGEYRDNGDQRYLAYTFTDCVKSLDIRNFETHVTYYVDPMQVKEDRDIEVSQSVFGGKEETFPISVDYRGAETSHQTKDMALATKITHVDSEKKMMTCYLYLNRKRRGTDAFPKNLELTGEEIDLNNAVVTIFAPVAPEEKVSLMPASFGVDETKLDGYYMAPARNDEHVVKLKNEGETQALTVDFENLLYPERGSISASRLMSMGFGYIVKVTCPLKDKSHSARLYTKYRADGDWIARHNEVYMTENASNLNGEMVVTRTNRKNAVEFEKTDVAGKPLKGALFDLYKGQTCVQKGITVDAQGRMTLKGLASGSYTLKETKAPEGYKVPRGAVATFTVTQKGAITDVSALGAEGTLCKESHTIVNTKGFYPSTGGMGFALYICAGLILMGTSLVFIRKRQ